MWFVHFLPGLVTFLSILEFFDAKKQMFSHFPWALHLVRCFSQWHLQSLPSWPENSGKGNEGSTANKNNRFTRQPCHSLQARDIVL